MPQKSRNKKHPSRHSRSFAVDGDRLRSLRVANGWTQEEAAKKAGVSDRSIRKAESGGPLEVRSLAILAELYSSPERKLTPDDLLAEALPGTPAPSPPEDPSHAESLVRRWFDELWNRRRLEVIEEMLSPDVVHHTDGRHIHGPDAIRRWAIEILEAFGEFELELTEITVLNDIVVCRWRASVRHTGTWEGIAPTGEWLSISGSSWIRFEDGRFTEGWDYWAQPLDDVVSQ